MAPHGLADDPERIMNIPGIGPLIAAMRAAFGDHGLCFAGLAPHVPDGLA